MKAKKSLGQNFLTSTSALRAIIGAASLVPEDFVLEVGPGRGVLTAELLKITGRVVAVEKDESLVEFLRKKFAPEISSGKLKLVIGDILGFNPSHYQLSTRNYKLIANIPYYITGEFLRTFLSADYQPKSLVLMLQKEVAERIVAKNEKESILSISVKAYGDVGYIKTVPAGSFSPAPKVDSAIISIENVSKKFFKDISEEKFFAVVRAGFAHKRKLLFGNLSKFADKEKLREIFGEAGISEKSRAEDLNLEQWRLLTQQI